MKKEYMTLTRAKKLIKQTFSYVKGQLLYVKKANIYIIMIRQGYNNRKTIYKNKIYYTLAEILDDIYSKGQ